MSPIEQPGVGQAVEGVDQVPDASTGNSPQQGSDDQPGIGSVAPFSGAGPASSDFSGPRNNSIPPRQEADDRDAPTSDDAAAVGEAPGSSSAEPAANDRPSERASGTAAGTGTASGLDADLVEQLMEAAKSSGTSIVIIEPGSRAGSAAIADTPTDYATLMIQARTRLLEVLSHAPTVHTEIHNHLMRLSPFYQMETNWTRFAAFLAIAAMAAGTVFQWIYRRWARHHFLSLATRPVRDDGDRLIYLLSRLVLSEIGVLIFCAVSATVMIAFDIGHDATRITAMVSIFAVTILRAIMAVVAAILAPDAPAFRIVNATDRDARRFYYANYAVLAISVLLIGVNLWLSLLNVARDIELLLQIVTTFLVGVLLTGLFVAERRMVTKIILGRGDIARKPVWLRLIGATWQVAAVLYFVVAWSIVVVRLVLDMPTALSLPLAPVIALDLALLVYAVLVVIILLASKNRRSRLMDTTDAVGADATELFQPTGEAGEAGANDREPRSELNFGEAFEPDSRDDLPSLRKLGLRLARLIAAATAILVMADIWFGGSFWEVAPVDVIFVVVAAYLIYAVIKTMIDRKIVLEGGRLQPEDNAMPTGDEFGNAESRLATLLPLVRTTILAVIVSIAAMIALSDMGVDIAPLFAGAGVVGLAVGFGAQTLIRDIFSGVFFLIDDAFRKGEYIDVGTVKGTVEKISLRSMQLRHHLGPLNTIPFGAIEQVTNYARDWVMLKLPLRVTYDTDVEKVRKLIKKLGQELLQDPVIGSSFLQPLKSQGVVQMEDSAMIIRVKFMTRPGDQFVARRVVYQRIRELFEREGISFAHKEVTVRVADSKRTLTDKEKEAVTGAVRPVIDDDAALANSGGSGGDDR